MWKDTENSIIAFVPRNSFVIGRKCQIMHFRVTCSDNQFRHFSTAWIFYNKILVKQFANVDRHSVLWFGDTVSYVGSFTDRNSRRVLKFFFETENQTFRFFKPLGVFHQSVYQCFFACSFKAAWLLNDAFGSF